MRYILAILLMSALCVAPVANAYELKMDETLRAPAVETVTQPTDETAPEPSLDLSLPVWFQWALLFGVAVFLAWRLGVPDLYRRVMKGFAVRKRAVRRAENQRRKRPSEAIRTEQRHKTVAGPMRAPAAEASDLAKAKALLLEENYSQASLAAIDAIRSEPYSLDAYAVALKILSSYQTPQLKGVVRGGLQLLRLKNPRLWRDVAVLGRKLAPDIEDWDDEPISKTHS